MHTHTHTEPLFPLPFTVRGARVKKKGQNIEDKTPILPPPGVGPFRTSKFITRTPSFNVLCALKYKVTYF